MGEVQLWQSDGLGTDRDAPAHYKADLAEVLVGIEIRSKSIRHPKPEENRTKVYIKAEQKIKK